MYKEKYQILCSYDVLPGQNDKCAKLNKLLTLVWTLHQN